MIRYALLPAAMFSSVVVQPAVAAPMNYGCDTPADHFSAIDQKVSLKNFNFTAKIQPNEFRKGKYSPLAQVYFESVDEKTRWALQVAALGPKDKAAIAMLVVTKNGKSEDPFPVGAVEIGKQLPFTISIVDGSKLNFNIDGLKGTPELNLGEQATLNIVCSTGDFIFSEMEWTEK
jgi:hypothetical protein